MMERTEIHPLRRIQSLLHMQRGTLPRSMKYEHELLTGWAGEASDRNMQIFANAKAARDVTGEVFDQVRKSDIDEFSKMAVYSRLEAVMSFHDRIVEKASMALLAVAIVGAWFSGGVNMDLRNCPIRMVRVVRMVRTKGVRDEIA